MIGTVKAVELAQHQRACGVGLGLVLPIHRDIDAGTEDVGFLMKDLRPRAAAQHHRAREHEQGRPQAAETCGKTHPAQASSNVSITSPATSKPC